MNECAEKCRAECCKRYWVTVLPSELSRIIDFTKISEKKFVEENCVLFAELIPLNEKGTGIVLFNELLPKKIALKVKECLGFTPGFFLALPFMAFKRVGGKCIFLNEKNLCKIHQVKPKQCELFPELSFGRLNPGKIYSFCLKARKAKSGVNKEHFEKIKSYFIELELNGFSKLWKRAPQNGIIRVRPNFFRVSKKEFLTLLGPYS